MNHKLFLLLILFFFTSSAVAKNELFYYQPKIVELTGIVKDLTFPGPPNYFNINEGDKSETGGYLILKNSVDIDVLPNTEVMGNDEPEKYVKIIQLVVYDDQLWEKLKDGNRVRIKGTLFRALTGHHHTRVLLEVQKVIALPKQKVLDDEITITQTDYNFMGGNEPEREPKIRLKVKFSWDEPSEISEPEQEYSCL